MLPSAPSIEGTLGAVAALAGQYGEGANRLIAAIRALDPRSVDKPELVRLVVMIEEERGEIESAHEWQHLRSHLQAMMVW